jgi:hypothetical protein
VAKYHKTGDWKEAHKRLSKFERLILSNLSVALRFSSRELVRKLRGKIKRGDIGWEPLAPLTETRKGNDLPWKDSGALYNSIKSKRINRLKYFTGISDEAKNKYGTPLGIIAQVQEFGKVITPTKGKYLAVPITKEAQELQHKYGSARNIPGVFRIKGRRVLVRKKGRTVEVMFVLLTKVKIPPRSVFRSTITHEKRTIQNRFRSAIKLGCQGRRYIR